jgi:hypothetical protein
MIKPAIYISLPSYFFIFLLSLTGCAASVKIDPLFEKSKLVTLAVLPIIDKTELPTEQMIKVGQIFTQELKNAGFLVLDKELVNKACPETPCTDTSMLFSNFHVDGTIQLSLDSSSRNNFLAGYYNAISGALEIKDSAGKQLISASATEREKGGLLFNSSQVLQGLISQFANSKDSSEESLIDKFLKSLIANIPRTGRMLALNADSTAISIKKVIVKAPEKDVRGICVEATANSVVSFLVEKTKSPLPEVSPGLYCRSFLLNPPFKYNLVQVEARSPFGNSVRSDVQLEDSDPCISASEITYDSLSPKPKLTFQCMALPRNKKREFIVYREIEDGLRYQKTATVSSLNWVDPVAVGSAYVVIERSPSGDLSLPLYISTKKKS